MCSRKIARSAGGSFKADSNTSLISSHRSFVIAQGLYDAKSLLHSNLTAPPALENPIQVDGPAISPERTILRFSNNA